MFTKIFSAALLGSSAVIAAPSWNPPSGAPGGPGGPGGPPGPYQPNTTSPPQSAQTPFKFPLGNGFPNIKNPSAQLTQIEEQAHGTLPNSPGPTELNATSVTTLELIAFNEAFEVAFFTSLISNITNNVPGFEIGSSGIRNFVLQALIAVQAQEELHFLGANGILAGAGQTQIQPCEYVFPSDTFDSAIDFARTFTDLVLGTLQDALNNFATDGDTELVPLFASVIGQEGEQNGYYRSLLDLIPSELPFLTRSTGPWAFSKLNQAVVVPGSCPNENIIHLPIFGALNVDPSEPAPTNQELTFSFKNNGTDTNSISLVYTNQQNLPIVEKPTDIQTDGDEVTFKAFLPFEQFIMNGLTIAVVTNSAGPFSTADEVAAATLFGPALIEIN